MIFSRKYNFLFNLMLIYACLSFTHTSFTGDFDDDGDIFFNDDMWDNLDASALPNITRSADNVAVLNALTSAVPVNNVVSGNFYLETNPINQRALTSLPNYMIYHSDKLNEEFLFNGYILYNETFKQNFTKKSTNLGAYLNLNTQDILDKISGGVVDFSFFPPLLELAQNAKIQDRRIGLMFQFFKNYGRWSFDATVPLTYQERNYFFSTSEESILRLEISKFTGTTSASADRSFFEKIAVSDSIGFGDLKFRAGYRAFTNDYIKLKAGFDCTIPTSFAFAKGLLGSNFRANLTEPTIDLTYIYNLANPMPISPENQALLIALGKDLAVQVGKRLGAIVLNQSLGNYHHFTLGAFFDTKLIYNQNTSCLIMGEFLYAIPKTELRFFNQLKNPADFTTAALTDAVNALPPGPAQDALAAEKMAFLDANAVSFLFPTAADTRVAPRFEVQFCLGPQFEFGAYLLHIGYNFWHRSQEHLSDVRFIEPYIYPPNIAQATEPGATQNKIFGRFDYHQATVSHIWRIAICLDQTLGSSGIGKDFNFALELSVDF
jgi:hypothetical protein